MARKSKGSSNGTRKQNRRLSRRALLGLGTGLALTSLGAGKTLNLKMANANKALFKIPDLSNGYIEVPGGVTVSIDKDGGRINLSCPHKPTTPKP